ncbi:helix-turn-helix domain containing protein [Bacillus mycoides]|uniref:Helix-turn-helix domain containing protein n=1 Tax=Bacillus thuringiensis serovar navarrensis TaxID=339658 RepID=A0A243ABS1_BACTU|nr:MULTISPECIES: helix-turn-helix domain containing protein [Bacillus]MBJ7998074.1 helix-turn-helix domain containing protein [Bacillus cereus]MED1267000.1 helix-turn-helix domain containing protein [Bacillus mycoides]OTY16197.1 helix-turn-helix domain containing protein [Bacillus thuringiensis serovar navarrensis]QWH85532.1 helix-turn-helix domain containing protein [Bacillus mycoides]QWI97633.1 helix-turn-helix domain containing protein [Bacillus mycoides]
MSVVRNHEAMKESRLKIYIALEEANFIWDERDIIRFREMWKQDMSLPEMAKALRRHQSEVALLIIDQADKYMIENRPMGLGVC